MRFRPHERLVIDEIEKLGGVIDSLRKTRHLVIYWTANGNKIVTACSSSPSENKRGFRNMQAVLRRAFKEAA